MGLTSIVFQSLPTEESSPVGQFTWERGFSSRNRKGQLWEYLLSRISRVSKCLTRELERWDMLSTYELYVWFQVFYYPDANDLRGQGCSGKVSWWFHSRHDTYSHHYFGGCLQSQVLVPRLEWIYLSNAETAVLRLTYALHKYVHLMCHGFL
jgi:hypothetical protein